MRKRNKLYAKQLCSIKSALTSTGTDFIISSSVLVFVGWSELTNCGVLFLSVFRDINYLLFVFFCGERCIGLSSKCISPSLALIKAIIAGWLFVFFVLTRNVIEIIWFNLLTGTWFVDGFVVSRCLSKQFTSDDDEDLSQAMPVIITDDFVCVLFSSASDKSDFLLRSI